MKVGLSWFFIKPLPFDPDVLAHYAKEADRLGFESIRDSQHAAIPHGYKTHYPYSPTGRLPTDDEEMPFPDPFISLAFAAGVTSKIKFGTYVIILPQHHPLYLAKQWRRWTCFPRAALHRYRLGMAKGGVRFARDRLSQARRDDR